MAISEIARYAPPYLKSLELVHQGKTRDTFAISGRPNHLLIVATDRVSTHNVVHKSTIPNKGYVLTHVSVHMMQYAMPSPSMSHLELVGKRIYEYLPGNASDYPEDLHFRGIVVKKLEIVPVEFIWRAFMTGSLWKKYYSKGKSNPYELDLPAGLKKMTHFASPIFTPTRKTENDEELPTSLVEGLNPEMVHFSKVVFDWGLSYALARGITVLDGKFEIGRNSSGEMCLADEIFTPDSCRFVDSSDITEGVDPPWLDKQILRDEAEQMWNGGEKVPLVFSDEAILRTSDAYCQIMERLTGKTIGDLKAN